ncbi:O-antigen ligase [Okibacterium sp. HSC-33S16]|uniref:O-antigen ligase family protein n=1 Tax=Okibacterium sp. HSC-33S16 TaxID=2910965 RepID=UPI00209CC53F|nr:O-antigen ligase family protein [Okibacterium sp. HSC-33S16]MCP2031553.1 O-antigen ligase [Okibacterium sp. HSC-33S16]
MILPSRRSQNSDAVRTTPPKTDAVTILTLYLAVLYLVPSDRIVPALGGAGSPSVWCGLAALIWWLWFHLQRQESAFAFRHRPVATSQLIFLATVLASYIIAMTRPLSTQEANGADLGLIRLAGLAGVLLLAHDGIPSRARFVVFLRRLVIAGGLMASLGLLQFLTEQSFVDSISIPGLTPTQPFSSVQDRSGFARAAGTAMHPLEYATVLSLIFPIALTLALNDKNRHLLLRWGPVAAIVVALTLSSSRSALLGLLIGVLILFPTWPRPTKIRALLAAFGLLIAVYALVPGMIGTLRYLFGNISEDPSAQSRTSSYDLVMDFFLRNPLLGRGFGTFLPMYRILDNQYLQLLMDVGLVGLCAFVAVLITSALSAFTARRHTLDPLQRGLGQALGASICAGGTLTAFFDALAFPMAGGTLFLVCGLCGAYWMLSNRESRSHAAVGTDSSRSASIN